MVKSKNSKQYHKFISLGQNTFIHCSQITVVHVHGSILSKIHPACHNDANGIKAGSNSNMTDKHDAECSKAAYLGVN